MINLLKVVVKIKQIIIKRNKERKIIIKVVRNRLKIKRNNKKYKIKKKNKKYKSNK